MSTAASGAAPADRLKAAIDAIAPRFESANPIPVQKTTVPVEEWTELLAALNAVIVALASPQVAPALTDMMKVWGMSAADLEAGPDRTSMDHYNKGVAAGIRQCIADCTRLATPVQVAPQDDARDAAEVWNEAIEAAARRIEGGSFLHDKSPAKLFANELAPVIRSMKRTPAAKPTEEQGS